MSAAACNQYFLQINCRNHPFVLFVNGVELSQLSRELEPGVQAKPIPLEGSAVLHEHMI